MVLITGDAIPDGIRVERSVLGTISSRPKSQGLDRFSAPVLLSAPNLTPNPNTYGKHGAVGFVVEGGESERASERESERETTGYEPVRAAQGVVAGEGGETGNRKHETLNPGP
jgi:hypothetical protein